MTEYLVGGKLRRATSNVRSQAVATNGFKHLEAKQLQSSLLSHIVHLPVLLFKAVKNGFKHLEAKRLWLAKQSALSLTVNCMHVFFLHLSSIHYICKYIITSQSNIKYNYWKVWRVRGGVNVDREVWDLNGGTFSNTNGLLLER